MYLYSFQIMQKCNKIYPHIHNSRNFHVFVTQKTHTTWEFTGIYTTPVTPEVLFLIFFRAQTQILQNSDNKKCSEKTNNYRKYLGNVVNVGVVDEFKVGSIKFNPILSGYSRLKEQLHINKSFASLLFSFLYTRKSWQCFPINRN